MKQIVTENDVKALVKKWYDKRETAWHYAPVQNGMGVHGILDRVGCVPVLVTQDMVGHVFGLFVSVECKRPGRRGEKNRGASALQQNNIIAINEAGGLAIVCDGQEDLDGLTAVLPGE
jgi:ribosomal protein S19